MNADREELWNPDISRMLSAFIRVYPRFISKALHERRRFIRLRSLARLDLSTHFPRRYRTVETFAKGVAHVREETLAGLRLPRLSDRAHSRLRPAGALLRDRVPFRELPRLAGVQGR